jgi:hypothetical protein
LRTQIQIYTEADYLQAHLTVIERGVSGRNASLDKIRKLVSSILRQSILVGHSVVPQLFETEDSKIREKVI